MLSPLLLSLQLLAAAPATATAATPASPWLTNLAAARAEARQSGKLIFVDLYAEWCGWCKVLDAKVFSAPQFTQWARDYVLLRVDTEDGGDGSDLYTRIGSGTLPTTLILRHDLAKVGEIQGYAPVDEYMDMIAGQLDQWNRLEEAYRNLVAGEKREDVRALAEGFHERGDGPRAADLYRRLLAGPAMDPELAAWTHYLLADALRIANDFEQAQRVLDDARRVAGTVSSDRLLERLDLLAVQVAEDRGDCRTQANALESFLKLHPESGYASRARRTLDTLRGEPRCS